MSETGYRYKDVLYALAVAKAYNQHLGKIQLQKYIYLADTLAPIWNLISGDRYRTYKNGPYDRNIQNAVDVFAFRGAVTIVKSDFHAADSIHVSYEISDIGQQIVVRLREQPEFSKKLELYEILGKYINKRGWNNLMTLVYSEPTFVSSKGEGYGVHLGLDSLLTNETLQILLGFNTLFKDNPSRLGKKSLVSIFFQLLDNYQILTKGG